jgi:beta-galactosidase
MDRRSFLAGTAGTLLAAPALGHKAADPSGVTARQVLALNRNWRYSREAVPGAREGAFDDSRFERVTLPHANIRLPWHSFDEKSYQFVSVYRRRFRVPASARGRHVFVDFEGVMTAATVWLNGTRVGEHRGGFTPFSFDLTSHLDWDGENVLAVEVDSTERADIPPFGYQLDYLTFGGIYREVSLRVVSAVFLENVFIRPQDVLSGKPVLEVDCFIEHLEPTRTALRLELALLDGDHTVATASRAVSSEAADSRQTVRFNPIAGLKLWDLDHPNLYRMQVRLLNDQHALLDEDVRTFGLRSARFTERGFELNGRKLKLRGLNRHQTFPFAGGAMPARVQRRDAEILRRELKCNIVRTSHYPQSRHFLDACDQLGLLVLEEIPGWQHIGDEGWKALSVENVRRMIRRDWNHPAIVLWGVRINESSDDDAFYTQTNAVAHELDPTRQTGGIRAFRESKLLEDVFTRNDFGFPLEPPNHPLYLNTEFVGHTYNTRSTDNADRLVEHTLRHARIHDQLASDPRYAGGIGWCAFDYNTHANFGSGDRMCYHGVSDIFREPKPAAGFYRSQCEPTEEVVVQPALHWAPSDQAGGLMKIVVCSNCEHLKLFTGDKLFLELDPDRKQFPHLRYPPFVAELGDGLDSDQWGDLRIEGYIGGRQVIVRHYSGRGIDQKLVLAPDDTQLVADGADTTRVVLRVTDEFGNPRPLANGPITLTVTGPAELIGDNPFVLVGGVGAVWIRAREQSGTVSITARHPTLGEQTARIEILAAPPEPV